MVWAAVEIANAIRIVGVQRARNDILLSIDELDAPIWSFNIYGSHRGLQPSLPAWD